LNTDKILTVTCWCYVIVKLRSVRAFSRCKCKHFSRIQDWNTNN